jgi:mono/diheme cytochrome c family protein
MKTFLKWIAYVLGGIVGLLIIGGVVAFTASNGKLGETYDVAAHETPVPPDSAALDRGRHLSMIMGCAECHGENFGGQVLIDEQPFATLYATNLTSGEGGALNRYDDAGLAKAIRHGIRHDGRSLIIMPAPEYNHLSDEDVGAIIAWIRRAAPVDNVTPEPNFGPVGRVLLATGQLDAMLVASLIDHDAPHLPAPPAGPTVEYGRYLARICTGCHGPAYAGSTEEGPGGTPPALNLTPAGRPGSWTVEQFITAMRTGVTPNGYELDPVAMPWGAIGQATDVELEAIHRFLQSLPPAQPEP